MASFTCSRCGTPVFIRTAGNRPVPSDLRICLSCEQADIRHLEATQQADLPLATSGVRRYVWEHRFGEMLIEVVDGAVLVNGERVEPAASAD